jgi:hypothetical protein
MHPNQEIKSNAKHQDVNAPTTVIYPYMAHKISNAHVNILIKIMIQIKKIVKLVHVKRSFLIGHVHVDKNTAIIKQYLQR